MRTAGTDRNRRTAPRSSQLSAPPRDTVVDPRGSSLTRAPSCFLSGKLLRILKTSAPLPPPREPLWPTSHTSPSAYVMYCCAHHWKGVSCPSVCLSCWSTGSCSLPVPADSPAHSCTCMVSAELVSGPKSKVILFQGTNPNLLFTLQE